MKKKVIALVSIALALIITMVLIITIVIVPSCQIETTIEKIEISGKRTSSVELKKYFSGLDDREENELLSSKWYKASVIVKRTEKIKENEDAPFKQVLSEVYNASGKIYYSPFSYETKYEFDTKMQSTVNEDGKVINAEEDGEYTYFRGSYYYQADREETVDGKKKESEIKSGVKLSILTEFLEGKDILEIIEKQDYEFVLGLLTDATLYKISKGFIATYSQEDKLNVTISCTFKSGSMQISECSIYVWQRDYGSNYEDIREYRIDISGALFGRSISLPDEFWLFTK